MVTTDTLIADYLDRLRRASADLPAGRRAELVEDIRMHLADTVGAEAGEARLRQVLDELGTPEEIVAAAAAESGGGAAAGARGTTGYRLATVLVLLLGGFVVPVLGWVAGVLMLWTGRRWSARDRWLGTLVWPVAIVLGVAALTADHAARGELAVVLVLGLAAAVVGLVVGFAHLFRAAARPAR